MLMYPRPPLCHVKTVSKSPAGIACGRPSAGFSFVASYPCSVHLNRIAFFPAEGALLEQELQPPDRHE